MSKYQEALERARIYYNNAKEARDYFLIKKFETIFPELKENDDAIIKKELIDFINHYRHNTDITSEQAEWCKKALAYLEKQKEQHSSESNNLDVEIKRFFDECIVVHEAEIYKRKERVIEVGDYELTARHFAKWGEKQKETLYISETCKDNADSFTDNVIEVRSSQRGIEEGRRLEREKQKERSIPLEESIKAIPPINYDIEASAYNYANQFADKGTSYIEIRDAYKAGAYYMELKQKEQSAQSFNQEQFFAKKDSTPFEKELFLYLRAVKETKPSDEEIWLNVKEQLTPVLLSLVQKEQKPILEVFGFKVGDKVRLKDGDGRTHIIKSFEEVEGLHGPNFYHVIFEDDAASDHIIPGKEYIDGYFTHMEKIEKKEQKPDDIKREWWNKGYIEGRKNAHIPARELGLPSSLDFKQEWNKKDKRIREALVSIIKWFGFDSSFFVDNSVTKSEVLAWLEKQEEQKPLQSENEKEYVRTLKGLVSDFIRDCGGGITDIEYYQQVCDWLDERHVQQKPAEYDGKDLLHVADKSYDIGFRDGVASVKPVEWSEEDELMILTIIQTLEMLGGRGTTGMQIDWLKSLRPQPHWKPNKDKVSDNLHPEEYPLTPNECH